MTDQLNPDALHKALNELPGWSGTKDGISRTYSFDDESAAQSFADRASSFADSVDHHPDVTVEGSMVTLFLVTHSAGGVTQKDLDFATSLDTGEAHGDAK